MRRNRNLVTGALLALLLMLSAAPAASAHGTTHPYPSSWAFAIGTGTLNGDLTERYGAYGMVVVDGQEAKRSEISELQAAGVTVLGYLSVGTIEDYRPWYRSLKRYRIQAWKDWEGEYFARINKRGFRRKVGGKIAPRLYRKGFDGLFLDNFDMIESYPAQKRGMRMLVGKIAKLVHADGGMLFAQNGYDVIGPLVRHLDGWNREDVSFTYDFDRDRYIARAPGQVASTQKELSDLAARGLIVTATDYTATAGGEQQSTAVNNACAAGALPFVSNIELRRIPASPLTC